MGGNKLWITLPGFDCLLSLQPAVTLDDCKTSLSHIFLISKMTVMVLNSWVVRSWLAQR